MRWLNVSSLIVLFGCGPATSADVGDGDAALTDVGTDAADSQAMDAEADASGGTFECNEAATLVATAEAVTTLDWAGAFLLVGSASALESRGVDLSVIDREAVPAVNVSAAAGRVAIFDGTDAQLYAINESGELSAAGRFDVSGRSVLALRGPRLFTFRYPLEARINTIEARDIEDLASPVALGVVQVEGTGPADVQLEGERAYALDSMGSRLTVIDISNPEAMSVTSMMDLPGIVETSELEVTPDGVFVGSMNGLVHVDSSGSNTSAGGPLVARGGDRFATASATQIFVYRLRDAGLESVATYDAESLPTALLWTDDALIVGSVDGLRSRRCLIR